MRTIFSLLIFMLVMTQATATEVNGNFKDECKFLQNRIEKDIKYMKKYYNDDLEVAAVITKSQHKELLSYYKMLCD